MKITIGKNGAFETVADAMEYLEECPGTYELELRDEVYVWPEGIRTAVRTMTITIPTKGEKEMEELKDRINALQSGFCIGLTRDRVLKAVEEHFAEYPPGTVEVRGCRKEEIEDCLRMLCDEREKLQQSLERKSYRDACRRLVNQVKLAGAVRDRFGELADDLGDLFQTFEDEAKRISERRKE